MMAACKAEAQKNKWNVAIAIVDDSGAALLLDRMDGAGPISAKVAMDKALFKRMARGIGLPVTEWREVRAARWAADPGGVLDELEAFAAGTGDPLVTPSQRSSYSSIIAKTAPSVCATIVGRSVVRVFDSTRQRPNRASWIARPPPAAVPLRACSGGC